MSFKKNNIQKKSNLIPNIVGLLSIFIIFSIGFIIIQNIDFFSFQNNIIDEGNNNQKIKKVEEKSKLDNDGNKINILVVGRGGGNHDAPNLTDTIILASINTEKKIISMLSIPRDFYVEYPDYSNNGTTNHKNGKINGLYAKYSFESGSQNVGMDVLKNKISEITGEKIDYFINVDFKGFTEIIDTIGGIEINIPTNFVDKQYPDGNWGYRTLIFKKGTWVFDGENSLKYARSRHSTSDFDRSMRQQQVIKAIKDKLSGSYFLTSPGKIKELYEVFINHVHTDLTLSTIIKLAYYLNGNGDFKIITSNLNDSCFYGSNTCEKGGFLYTPNRELFGGMSVLLAEGTNIMNLNNYDKLHLFTKIIFNNPEIFNENYKINIFNSLKINHLAGALSNEIVKYGFNIPASNSIGNTKTVYKKSIIYYNNIDENSITLKILKYFFDGEFKKTNFPVYSKDNAQIEIIIGEDYISNKKIFKF